VRWLDEATSDGRSVSDSQPPTQTACHGTLFSLTTTLKHSRQVWNHYSDTLPRRGPGGPMRRQRVSRPGDGATERVVRRCTVASSLTHAPGIEC